MMSKQISTGIGSTARHRRLEIHRMRSVRTSTTTSTSRSRSTTTTAAMKTSSTENDGGVVNHFAVSDDVCIMRRRRAIADVTSSESTSTTCKKSKIDLGDSKSEMTLSGSSSSPSENEGVPLGILVPGGEFSGENETRSLTCVSHGSISVIGRRREMEDTVTVAPGILAGVFASYDFFAVYDGHGGSRVSLACRDRMHQLLAKEVEGWTRGGGDGGVVDWEIAMAACFKKMDDEVSVGGGDGDEVAGVTLTSVAVMGSTAVVVVVGEKEIVVANCGDSRAVLCRGGVPVPLSRDHKPDRPDERERVEAAGGKIINWNGCRVLGVLATSRSIGDQYLKPYVISEPEVTVNERTESDGFIIVASDGLWDVLSNEVACEVVRRCLGGQVKRRFAEEVNGSYSMEAAAMLAELAMARGSKDNISVIVVELKRLLESPS